MLDDKEIIELFNKYAQNFIINSDKQRREIQKCFEYRDGHQWSAEHIEDRKSKDQHISTIPLIKPLLDTASGTEVMQDKVIEIVPMADNYDARADIMNDIVEWEQHVSHYDSQKSDSKHDALNCGLGATDTFLDIPDKGRLIGDPRVKSIYPGFILFDTSVGNGNLNLDSSWCGYATAKDSDSLRQYMKRVMKDKYAHKAFGGDVLRDTLLSFTKRDNLSDIDLMYNFFWYEYEDVYNIENPFIEAERDLAQLVMESDFVNGVVTHMMKELQLDFSEPAFSLDGESWKEFQANIKHIEDVLQIDLEEIEYTIGDGKCYYRAEIAHGVVLKKSRTSTQDCFPMVFYQGDYDATMGVYYGLTRPLSFMQDELNRAFSNLSGYADNVNNGGGAYIKGNIESIKKLSESKAKDHKLTPLPPDAEVIAKATASAPQVLIETVRLIMDLMPRAAGLNQEFFSGQVSGNMTDSLYGSYLRQSTSVLAKFANNYASAAFTQAEVFIGYAKVVARHRDGEKLPVMSQGKSEEEYKRFNANLIADDYMMRAVERPVTGDKRLDTWNKLSALAPQLLQSGINIMPLIAKYAPLDYSDRQELSKLSAPPPPPQPDPLNTAMLESQIRMQNAQAANLESDAQSKMVSTQQKDREIDVDEFEANTKATKVELDARLKAEEMNNKELADVRNIVREISSANAQ